MVVCWVVDAYVCCLVNSVGYLHSLGFVFYLFGVVLVVCVQFDCLGWKLKFICI